MSLPPFGPSGLLPDGVHPAAPQELEARCVLSFPTSATRASIFSGLSDYRDSLARAALNVTQWVDGSFVDQARLDPEDVDVVNFCDAANLNAAANAAGEPYIGKLLDGGASTKAVYKTHSFLCVKFPAGHQWAASFEARRDYWRKWLSIPQAYSVSGKSPAPERGRKGIVQMFTGDARLCPSISDSA